MHNLSITIKTKRDVTRWTHLLLPQAALLIWRGISGSEKQESGYSRNCWNTQINLPKPVWKINGHLPVSVVALILCSSQSHNYTAAHITQVCAHGIEVWLLKTHLSTSDTCFSQSWQRRKTRESFAWLKFSTTNTNLFLKPAACHKKHSLIYSSSAMKKCKWHNKAKWGTENA